MYKSSRCTTPKHQPLIESWRLMAVAGDPHPGLVRGLLNTLHRVDPLYYLQHSDLVRYSLHRADIWEHWPRGHSLQSHPLLLFFCSHFEVNFFICFFFYINSTIEAVLLLNDFHLHSIPMAICSEAIFGWIISFISLK